MSSISTLQLHSNNPEIAFVGWRNLEKSIKICNICGSIPILSIAIGIFRIIYATKRWRDHVTSQHNPKDERFFQVGDCPLVTQWKWHIFRGLCEIIQMSLIIFIVDLAAACIKPSTEFSFPIDSPSPIFDSPRTTRALRAPPSTPYTRSAPPSPRGVGSEPDYIRLDGSRISMAMTESPYLDSRVREGSVPSSLTNTPRVTYSHRAYKLTPPQSIRTEKTRYFARADSDLADSPYTNPRVIVTGAESPIQDNTTRDLEESYYL